MTANGVAVVAVQSAPETSRRLELPDCVDLVRRALRAVEAGYVDGTLALLDADPDLHRRFHATESRIDELAKVQGGPTEADFRTAIDDHLAVWRELIGRWQALRQQHVEQPDPMPPLPTGVVLAVGYSYADGEAGIWEMER